MNKQENEAMDTNSVPEDIQLDDLIVDLRNQPAPGHSTRLSCSASANGQHLYVGGIGDHHPSILLPERLRLASQSTSPARDS